LERGPRIEGPDDLLAHTLLHNSRTEHDHGGASWQDWFYSAGLRVQRLDGPPLRGAPPAVEAAPRRPGNGPAPGPPVNCAHPRRPPGAVVAARSADVVLVLSRPPAYRCGEPAPSGVRRLAARGSRGLACVRRPAAAPALGRLIRRRRNHRLSVRCAVAT